MEICENSHCLLPETLQKRCVAKKIHTGNLGDTTVFLAAIVYRQARRQVDPKIWKIWKCSHYGINLENSVVDFTSNFFFYFTFVTSGLLKSCFQSYTVFYHSQ